MSDALYNRLKALKEGRGRETSASRKRGTGHGGSAFDAGPLPGWRYLAPGVQHRIHREPVSGLLQLRGTDASFLFPPPQERLLFFDCETTSLSGGAGNIVFLFGLGYVDDAGFAVEQFFLEDFPDEPAFVDVLAERLRPEYTYVSYNGRAFDAHLLRTRFLLNAVPFPIRRHVDLLYPSRRLWRRRLESCSLGSLEAHVLGIERTEDLPGAEVPDRYFDYLRRGDPAGLSPVFAHHRADIASLILLADTIDRIAAGLLEPRAEVFDPLGLASMLWDASAEEFRRRGVALLESLVQTTEVERGEEARDPWTDGVHIARRLCRHYRRQGDVAGIGRVWEEVHRRTGSLEAAVEYAKYLEHQERRYADALSVVESVVSRAEGPLGEALRRRQARLERRIASS